MAHRDVQCDVMFTIGSEVVCFCVQNRFWDESARDYIHLMCFWPKIPIRYTKCVSRRAILFLPFSMHIRIEVNHSEFHSTYRARWCSTYISKKTRAQQVFCTFEFKCYCLCLLFFVGKNPYLIIHKFNPSGVWSRSSDKSIRFDRWNL